MDDLIKKQIEEMVKQLIPTYLKNQGFTARKLTDSPTDDIQVVPRKYVNKFGSTLAGSNPSTLGRPINSVVGEQYFDTTKGGPVFRRPDGAWVDGVGSVV